MSFKVAVALGGGASRGLAHLGVLKALEEAGIKIDIVTGSSIGAIIGASYASHPKVADTIEQIHSYLHSPNFNQAKLNFIQESGKEVKKTTYGQFKKFISNSYFFAISSTQSSFITEDTFRNNLEHILPKIRIEDCELAFGVTMTNLGDGKLVKITRGDLIDHVLASSAIPGIFPPIKLGDEYFIDGSWVEPIPIVLARELGADYVIAVDVAPIMAPNDQEFTGFNVNMRASEATRIALKRYNLEQADFVVRVNHLDLHWADFMKIDECVVEGQRIMDGMIPRLKSDLFFKKFKSFFWPW